MNKVISGAWALAFAVIVAADLVMVLQPGLPLAVGIAISVAALVAAFRFSRWYPDHLPAQR